MQSERPPPPMTPQATEPPSRTEPGEVPPRTARRAFAGVCALVVLYAVLDVIAQLLPPHYSAITQAESDLAVGPFGWIMTINFVVRGLLTLLFLFALAETLAAEGRSWRTFGRGYAAFLVWGIGAFLLAAFPTDVPATPISWHEWIHIVVAFPAFLGGALGTYWLASRFDEAATLRSMRVWATVLAVFTIVFVILEIVGGLLLVRVSGRVGGLLERLFLGSVLLWMFLVSAYLAWAHPTGTRPAT